MLLMMLERKEPIHSVYMFDTEREFPEIIEHIKQVEANTGIKIQRIRDYLGFDFWENRYKKPKSSGGWCTANKRDNCNKYVRLMLSDLDGNGNECIGFSADEKHRAEGDTLLDKKKWPLRFPLIEWNISELDALDYCYSKGYDFNGIYKWMPSKRVSCYDCPKQSQSDWEAIMEYHPELYEKATGKKPRIQEKLFDGSIF